MACGERSNSPSSLESDAGSRDASMDAPSDAAELDAAAEPDATEPDAAESDAETPHEDELDPGAPLFRSGTRLRARVFQHAQEPVAYEGLYDSELGVDCRFRHAEDRHVYCLPDVSSTLEGYPIYADANCTQLATLERAACQEAPRFHLLQEYACDGRTRVFNVSPNGSNTWYEPNARGACVAQTDPGRRAFPLTEEVPLSRFVHAELKRTRKSLEGEALVREIWAGSDGSLATRGAASVSHGACEPSSVLDPTDHTAPLRCVPELRAHRANQTFFADATCTEPAAYTTPVAETCETPELVLDLAPEGKNCQIGGRPKQLFRTQKKLLAAYTVDYDLACVAAEHPELSGFSYFAIGADFPTHTLPEVSLGAVGEGRVKPLLWQNQAGQPLAQVLSAVGNASPLLWDDTLETRCEPLLFKGKWLCAPPHALVAYEDAQCERPLLEVFEAEDCPLDTPTLVSIRGEFEFTCSESAAVTSLAVYRLGEEMPVPATRHVRINDQCQQANTQAFVARYFALGERLALESLAKLEERAE